MVSLISILICRGERPQHKKKIKFTIFPLKTEKSKSSATTAKGNKDSDYHNVILKRARANHCDHIFVNEKIKPSGRIYDVLVGFYGLLLPEVKN